MKDASKKIIEKLQEQGYRSTQSRIDIVDVLVSLHKPVTIQALCKQIDVDEVSVYRTVALLCKEGFLEEITTHGHASRFAIAHGHHHHAVCTNCETIVHVPCDNATVIPKSIPGFSRIEGHEITFYGTCAKCS